MWRTAGRESAPFFRLFSSEDFNYNRFPTLIRIKNRLLEFQFNYYLGKGFSFGSIHHPAEATRVRRHHLSRENRSQTKVKNDMFAVRRIVPDGPRQRNSATHFFFQDLSVSRSWKTFRPSFRNIISTSLIKGKVPSQLIQVILCLLLFPFAGFFFVILHVSH